MHYFFQDLIGVAAATPLALLLLLAPGFGIARLMAHSELLGDKEPNQTCWSLLLAPTLLPAVDALLVRLLGFGAVLALHLALTTLGARTALDSARRVPVRWWCAVLGCWLAAAWANVDFDWNGRLYQSASVIDGVKHAAVIGSLARYGIPLHDPFFARPGAAGYYYYFYIGPALLHWLGGVLIDSRAAFAAATFVTILAVPAMLILVADAAALIPEQARRRFVKLTLLLCCVSGLDLLPAIWIRATMGHLLIQLDWWEEEVRWALSSVLWEPHHMSAVIAAFTGCLILATGGRSRLALKVAIAGLAFATAFGCSVWIALGAVPVLAVWWVYERAKLGFAGMWALPLSGAAALLLSLPQVMDIIAGRAAAGPPLAFYVRPVGPIRVLPHTFVEWIVHLAVLPGAYVIEFGIFAFGSIAFVTGGRVRESQSTPIGRLLIVAAPITLILVTFVRSAILYNDFGWRAIWLAQVPAMLWTASFLSMPHERAMRSPIWMTAGALGVLASMWDIAGMRLSCPEFFPSFVNAHPTVDYDLRQAYGWADSKLPPNLIVQHNPEGDVRALDFGLYSDRPVAVADADARLFGAAEQSVEQRISLLDPIFRRSLSAGDLRGRAAAAGVGAILLTSTDPLWHKGSGPPHDWSCDYRSAHSCLMLVGKLQ